METDDTKFEPLQDGAQSEQPREQWNRNVIICLILTGVNGFADSIWTGTVRPTRFDIAARAAKHLSACVGDLRWLPGAGLHHF